MTVTVTTILYNNLRMIKVLIVEENIATALDLKNAITQFGFNVIDIVSNKTDVLNSIEKDQPNIIIIDTSLAEKEDGIETVKSIYNINYIPVIYLTANEDDGTINRALETCPVAYFIKPFNKIELKTTIQLSLCEKKQFRNNKCKYLGFNYYFDRNNQHLYYKNEIQKLSLKELKLINLLIENNGELVTFDTIESEIWENTPITSDAIRLLVSRLRKKLKHNLIESIYSYGFKFYKKL